MFRTIAICIMFSAFAACNGEPALSIAEAKAQLAPFTSLSDERLLCNADKQTSFRPALKNYALALQADGQDWPDLSGEHTPADRVTRLAITALIAGFVEPSDFGGKSGAMKHLLSGIERDASRERPQAQRMASAVGVRVIAPLQKDRVAAAQKHACTSLVSYATALAEAEYVKPFAFGPQNDNYNEIQSAIRQYNRHIGLMMERKDKVIWDVALAERSE